MNNRLIQTVTIGLAILTVAITATQQHQHFVYASVDPETGNNINEEEEGRFTETPTPDGTIITDKKDGSCAHINPNSGNIYPCKPPGSLGHGGGVNVQ